MIQDSKHSCGCGGEQSHQVQQWGQQEAEEGLGRVQVEWGYVEKSGQIEGTGSAEGLDVGKRGGNEGPQSTRPRAPLRPGMGLGFYGVGMKMPTDPNRS